jgi:ArsR family transcriptional regulator, arsenate/arsenite/antimonite-responsive transcriptional repressor
MHMCASGGTGMHNLVKATKSLSEDTRLRIINVLLVRECCVCEVEQSLKISPTRASRNLSMLYDAGFLKMRKEGLWTLYSLNNEGMPGHLVKLVEAVALALENNQVAREDRDRLKIASRTGIACLNPGENSCSKVVAK